MTNPARASLLTPFPPDHEVVNHDLDLSAKVQGPSGWIDLQDEINYWLHSDSFGSTPVTWRKNDVNADWVEGSYTLSAVRENTTEVVSVWVKGDTHYEFRTKVAALEAAFGQTSYLFMKRIEDLVEYWTCPSPADYTIQTQHEYLHATRGLFAAQVIRLPTIQIVPAAFDEL